MDLLISNLIGIPIGILCSFVAWWITFHAIVPKVVFSEHISRTVGEDEEGVPSYRIKFRNGGKRDIVDVQLFARVYIDGLNPKRPTNQRIVQVSLGISHWPTLRAKGKSKMTRLYPQKTTIFLASHYPEAIRRRTAEGKLSLEDILSLGTDAKFHVVAFAYDAFSGTRKVFVSKYYRKGDIVDGYFAKDSLAVAPFESSPAVKTQEVCGQGKKGRKRKKGRRR